MRICILLLLLLLLSASCTHYIPIQYDYRKEIEKCVLKLKNGGVPSLKAFNMCKTIYGLEEDIDEI
jgi:hypothetical protein